MDIQRVARKNLFPKDTKPSKTFKPSILQLSAGPVGGYEQRALGVWQRQRLILIDKFRARQVDGICTCTSALRLLGR